MREPLLDTDGENRAVRSFLMHYGVPGLTVKRMRENMRMAGWAGCWPAWVADFDGHLTKGGAQAWLRHLFALETSDGVPEGVAPSLPADVFTVNFVRLAGLDKHKARECEAIVRQVLAARGVALGEAPSMPPTPGCGHSWAPIAGDLGWRCNWCGEKRAAGKTSDGVAPSDGCQHG